MTAKSKPVRKTNTPVRHRAAKSATTADAIDTLITANAATLALPIDPSWHANVKLHLKLILAHAARIEEFPLPDEIEAAPVFHA